LELSDFDYDLPEELIAQFPLPQRGASRLMVIERGDGGGRISHRFFSDLLNFLRPKDLLVLNDTCVIPARIDAVKVTGGRVRMLFLEEVPVGIKALISGKNIKKGTKIVLPGDVEAEIVGGAQNGQGFLLSVELRCGFFEYLRKWGKTPLPPYIKRGSEGNGDGTDQIDRERYQTVYADPSGSVAAPTAGLHFDEEALDRLRDCGIRLAKITLHVGSGTFLPIRSSKIEDHVMHSERYVIGSDAVKSIRRAKKEGGRVVAVGTTTVRALESAAGEDGGITAGEGLASLFIYPGYRFRVIDALLTNFHLPKSTLISLVSAFCGRDTILKAYGEAVENRYRFYSYGDAMLIL
jgi:S-adenosylmethionine:tRNA ribosyltransferase-isomerase